MARKRQNSSISLPHGRKRTVSPGFFIDPDLLALPPILRILFEGLWCFADREGRLLDKPIDLKIRIVPNDAIDCNAALATLADSGLICRYRAIGLRFIAMKPRPWKETQRLHPDEPDSAIPPPPDGGFRVPDHGNEPTAPIPVIGYAAVDPISGPGSSGSSGSSGTTGSSVSTGPSDRKGANRKRIEQPDLPAIPPAPPPPPRAKSAQELAYEDYQWTRRFELVDELKVDFVEDQIDEHGPAWINTALGPILKEVEPLARTLRTTGETQTGWYRLLELWFDQPWGAKMDPPFPFTAFVSDRVQHGDPGDPEKGKPKRPGLIERLSIE